MHDLTTPQVSLHHNRPVTTSLNVADVFGKKHKNITQTIREMDIPEEFDRLNFQPISYTDVNNRKQPAYELTRDGFTLLAMGFTGKAAMQWKIKYIELFNAMEHEIAEAPAHVAALERHLARELLKQRPEWKRIIRYKGYGLFHREIGKLMDMSTATVRKHVREMEACGLLTPPANLPAMQQGALRFRGEAHV